MLPVICCDVGWLSPVHAGATASVHADEISDQLEALVGDEVTVEVTHEVRAVRAVDPYDGIRWVYLARMPGDYDP